MNPEISDYSKLQNLEIILMATNTYISMQLINTMGKNGIDDRTCTRVSGSFVNSYKLLQKSVIRLPGN